MIDIVSLSVVREILSIPFRSSAFIFISLCMHALCMKVVASSCILAGQYLMYVKCIVHMNHHEGRVT